MKLRGAFVAVVLVCSMAACGDETGSDPDGSGGDGEASNQPVNTEVDLAALAGGTDPIQIAPGATIPDACSILSEEIVLAVAPDTGDGGRMEIYRSSTFQDGTAYMCQYAAEKADGTATGFITVSFQEPIQPVDAQATREAFESWRDGLADDPDFVDYGDELGPGTLAYSHRSDVEVLASDTRFTVSPGSPEGGAQMDIPAWRDHLAVPIAENMVQRLQP